MQSKEKTTAALAHLFEQWCGQPAQEILMLPPSGSNRQYFRLQAANHTAIGTYGAEPRENKAFLSFSRHFHSAGIAVPRIYSEDEVHQVYLQEDIGDTALFGLLPKAGEAFSEEVIGLYKESVAQLARMQIKGGADLDYTECYPVAQFDEQSIRWDLNYFKYYFLKLLDVPFDEQALENDFLTLANYLLQADNHYFMFRDFQSRNIMIRDGSPLFIDYQGGRKGALQYDLASLLFQAKANLPHDLRASLLEEYLDEVEKMISINRVEFAQYYYAFVLIRTLQVLGAYGYRGLYERKSHFLSSIPFALKNLRWLLANITIPVSLPALWPALETLAATDRFDIDHQLGKESPLTVYVSSFSYKFGMPEDKSGNGGGFVFDCRCLHNPGRYQPYKKLTGLEKPVIDFLEAESNIQDFFNNACRVIDEAVQNYLERGFASLMISFGCTGGQHRSVYSAERMKKYLEEKYGVKVVLRHLEGNKERGNWLR